MLTAANKSTASNAFSSTPVIVAPRPVHYTVLFRMAPRKIENSVPRYFPSPALPTEPASTEVLCL